MIRSLLLLLLLAQVVRAKEVPMSNPPPPPLKKDPTSPKIEAVKKQLSAVLSKSEPGAKVETRANDGPLDLIIVTAAIPGAYPGSGVARVLIDDKGVTYGIHGEKDFADLARERHWLSDGAIPDAATLLKLVDNAFFEGVALWLDKPAPKYQRAHGALIITLYRTWHPSGGTTRVTVTVPASGKAQLESVNEN
jgi:hypothetical protein